MVKLRIYVQPNTSQNSIVGLYDNALKVKLKTPPVDGKANKALIALLSKELETPKSNIHVISGFTSRTKIVEITDSVPFPDDWKAAQIQ